MTEPAKSRVRVTQVRGANNRTKDQQATLIGLGLGRLHRARELANTPSVRGMIAKVKHLLKVESVN